MLIAGAGRDWRMVIKHWSYQAQVAGEREDKTIEQTAR